MRLFLAAILFSLFSTLGWSADGLSAEDARKAALDGELTVVDIRTKQEWKTTGLPDVAHAMDMTQKGFVSRLLDLYEAYPDRPMAIICASGARSTYVVTALRERGLRRLINIREGMTGGPNGPGWLAKKLPVRTVDQPIVSE